MKNSSPNDSFSDLTISWNENANTIWIASVVLLLRNIEKFNFPGKLDVDRRKQIVWLVSRELATLEGIESPKMIKGEDCTPLEKEFLVEHCLTNESFHQAHQGEAFILDKKGELLVSVNIKDHLHLHSIDTKGELENAWNRLVKLEMQLGKSLAYSYSPKFGFLTADPFECGTGLVVSVYLQPSGLIHSGKLEPALKKLQDDAVRIGGLQGDSVELIGDLVKIRNNVTLGINEETIIATLRSFVTKLIVEENIARKEIRESASAEIKDKVARSFGILIHSYQIEAAEALNEIALLKLGLELGWLKGIGMKDLNRLFHNSRRAHLLRHFPEKVTQENIAHKRAEFIHQSLKDVTLTI